MEAKKATSQDMGVQPQIHKADSGNTTERTSVFQDFDDVTSEVMISTRGKVLADVYGADHALSDRMLFEVENWIAANPNVPFYLLGLCVLLGAALLGLAWWLRVVQVNSWGTEEVYGDLYRESLWLSITTMVAATSYPLPDEGLQIIYLAMLFAGILAFATMIGFITESITNFMTNLNDGKTKVASEKHTLILGWSEATVRVVCQLALVRQQYQTLNNSWAQRYLRMGRVKPSTPVADARIVIMCNTISKEEMEDAIRNGLESRGIDQKSSRVGTDIICRTGTPTEIPDLVHVAAHHASAILLMLSEEDQQQTQQAEGNVTGGNSIRCLLCLRHILASSSGLRNKDLRIVVELQGDNHLVECASFPNAYGNQIIYPLDVSVYLNSLMFSCADQPGLGRVIVELLSFDGFTIRRRLAQELGFVGYSFQEAKCSIMDGSLLGLVKSEGNQSEDGVCPPDEQIIQQDDVVVFCSETSMPRTRDGRQLVNDYQAKAQKIEAEDRHTVGRQAVSHVLVCGWRQHWSKSKDRLGQRFQALAERMAPGSSVSFLNKVPEDEFQDIMEYNLYEQQGDGKVWDFGVKETGIQIRHIPGEATRREDLENAMAMQDFDIVIVMGTTASSQVELTGLTRDARVLSILLMLRRMRQEGLDVGDMHVITENSLDSTMVLAPPPVPSFQGGGQRAKGADFVNTQAINARALVQTLAYPKISECISDLISDTGISDLSLIPATRFLPLQSELEFGVVQALVQRHQERVFGEKHRALCIGFLDDSMDAHYPGATEKRKYRAGDRLIIAARRPTTRKTELALKRASSMLSTDHDGMGENLLMVEGI